MFLWKLVLDCVKKRLFSTSHAETKILWGCKDIFIEKAATLKLASKTH